MNLGLIIAIIGALVAAVLAGLGSVVGVRMGGDAAAGVVSEKPELFGKILILQALPGTQGIYGFLVAVIVLGKIGLLGGSPAAVTDAQGWAIFAACMPIAIVGYISAVFQGKVAVSAIHMTAKQPDASVKGMTMTAMVETYAILALLVSILFVQGIQIG